MSYQMRPAPCLLIVEDDPVVGLVIEEMVRDQGWQVVGPVRRLEEAIEAAKSEDLDFYQKVLLRYRDWRWSVAF